MTIFANLANLQWQQVVMWAIGALLIYLAIKKEMEPALLLPMGFGAILVNLPMSGAVTQVFSNGATMVIVSSVIAQFAVSYAAAGVNVAVFPALIAQVCQMGCLTPAASGFAAMLLALPCMQKKPNWVFKSGTLMMLLYLIIAIPVGVLLAYVL